MNGEQTQWVAIAGGALALVLLLACTLLWASTRRLSARLAELEARLGDQPVSTPGPEQAAVTAQPAAYVITAMDVDPQPSAPITPGRIDGALFTDIVARESVVKAAGLAHGLRRALAPEARNRIRFEMKREVKRSRKQRRVDLKAALRDFQARERSGTTGARPGEDAA